MLLAALALALGMIVSVLGPGCSPDRDEAASPQALPPQQVGKLSFADILPTIEHGRVYGEFRAFSLALPPSWRVVPLPLSIYQKNREDGFEQMLLKPEVGLDIPYIKIIKLHHFTVKHSLMAADPEAGARSLLMQFLGGKHKATIMQKPLYTPGRNVLSVSYQVEPVQSREHYAVFFFTKADVLMVDGVFIDGDTRFESGPFTAVVQSLRTDAQP